jgi:aminoglycoside phosphotransferase (APT) family kinase protein
MASDVHVWTADEARTVLTRHGVDAQSMEPMPHTGWGGDSDAFLVNGTHVFRFGRYAHVRQMYAVERRFLRELGARLDAAGCAVRVPAFSHFGGSETGDSAVFVGYPIIAGEQMTPRLLAEIQHDDPRAAADMAAQLGTFLTVLHGMPLDVALRCGLRAPLIPLREQIARQRERIETQVYPVLDAPERRFLDDVFQSFLEDPRFDAWPVAVCHGDLGPDHILVRPGSSGRIELAGIIDFGDAWIDEPSGDLVWRRWYGEPFFRQVLDRYQGPVHDLDALQEMIRIRTALVPTVQIGWGLDTRSDSDVQEGRAQLREVMDGSADSTER